MNKKIIQVVVDNPVRVDKFIAENSEFSREYAKKLILNGDVFVNNNNVKSSFLVNTGDEIMIKVPTLTNLEIKPINLNLDVIFEDLDILIVNKPAGLVVHPSASSKDNISLVNGVLFHCGESLSGIGGVKRPGIVHRLDKDTSGIIVIAKNDKVHRDLSLQFKNRTVKKYYQTLVSGIIKNNKGRIVGPIGRDFRDRKKMAVVDDDYGKEAVTSYELIDQIGDFALLSVFILSGRTHQIRVHLSSINNPIVGDKVYGNTKINKMVNLNCGLNRQFLHASQIEFTHPTTKKKLVFNSNLSDDLLNTLDCIKSAN